jgi:catechol 2,3-dioxygenase-like lactoylglutathione lyase family enzyme
MAEPAVLRPCYRFLHICYCCADGGAARDFFVEHLAMKNTMNTPMERTPGGLLGIDSDITSQARFVYDRRGPRVSPAIEIQHWMDPPLEGTPSSDPFEVGLKAVGFAVPDLPAAVTRLVGAGCLVVAQGASPFDASAALLVDVRGITLELVADGALGAAETQMHHVRLTVSDLDASLSFYDQLGFDVIERGSLSDASFVGHEGSESASASGRYARVRLRDEQFEARLIQWDSPSGHGRHYANPYHSGLFRIALGVEDTRASYEAMGAAGAIFDRPPQDVVLSGTPVPNMWITFITDPDGIPYEFVQRERSAFR